MGLLIDSTHHPAIRAALDVSLDTKTLPDATIALQIYLDAAEAEVIARDPLAASRTGDAETHIENAAIFLTAARLAPAIPQLVRVNRGSVGYQRMNVDWTQRAAELRQLADAEIAAVLTPTETAPGRPTMFSRASGTRGK